MQTQKTALSPPSLDEIAEVLRAPLSANYEHAAVSIAQCPDLRRAPFFLANEGLCGDEKIADVGGESNLYPQPHFEWKWSMVDIAKAMEMNGDRGSLLGAGAGPFHIIGRNCELVPNFSWLNGFDNTVNQTRLARIKDDAVNIEKSPSLDCALMANLYGSRGNPGNVLKITARKRVGSEKSFTDCIQNALAQAYGTRIVSLGGTFVIKQGVTYHHIMPDFPPSNKLPWHSLEELYEWLTFHNFSAPIVCLSVLHSADPEKKLGLRIQHTHCASMTGQNAGGHYHGDTDGEVEYEGYFNVAQFLYRIDRPETSWAENEQT